MINDRLLPAFQKGRKPADDVWVEVGVDEFATKDVVTDRFERPR